MHDFINSDSFFIHYLILYHLTEILQHQKEQKHQLVENFFTKQKKKKKALIKKMVILHV